MCTPPRYSRNRKNRRKQFIRKSQNFIYHTRIKIDIRNWQYRENVYIFNGNTLKLMTDIITVFFVLALCIKLCEKNYFTLKKILSFIYSASFTVYLSHCLFLQITQSLMDRLNVSDMGILIITRGAVCYTVPFLMWFVFNKIRLYSRKLHNSPRL